MIVPAIGGLASGLTERVANGVGGQSGAAPPAATQASAGVEGVGGLESTAGVGATSGLGGAGTTGLEGTGGASGTSGVGGTNGAEGASGLEGGAAGSGEASGSFGSELSEAISSLEGTQLSADSAARSLATGTAKDPESAVVTVEDAQMAMDLAAQLRTKAAEAAQSIFQTQV